MYHFFNLVQEYKSNFFGDCPFGISFPFSRPFNSRYLLRCIFLMACRKHLGVDYGQSLEMGP